VIRTDGKPFVIGSSFPTTLLLACLTFFCLFDIRTESVRALYQCRFSILNTSALYSVTIDSYVGLFDWEKDKDVLEGKTALEFRVLDKPMKEAIDEVAEPLREMVKEYRKKKKKFFFFGWTKIKKKPCWRETCPLCPISCFQSCTIICCLISTSRA